MKDGKITPPGGPQVTPVVYLDLDVVLDYSEDGAGAEASEHQFLEEFKAYPGVQAILLTERGPSGHPIYRVEGPLDELAKWYFTHYGRSGSAESDFWQFSQAKLAR